METFSKKHLKIVRRAIELLEQVEQERATHYDDKSERWQESDKGQDYQSDSDEFERMVDDLRGFA